MTEAQKSWKLWNMQHMSKSTKSDKHGHEAIGRVEQNGIKHALKQWKGNPDKHCFIIYLCYLLSYWDNPKSCFSVSDKMIWSSHTNVHPVFSHEKTETNNLLSELTKTNIFWMLKLIISVSPLKENWDQHYFACSCVNVSFHVYDSVLSFMGALNEMAVLLFFPPKTN